MEFTVNQLKNGVELFNDFVTYTNDKSYTIKRDTTILRQLSLGAITSDSASEWYTICKLHAPLGTIIEEYDSAWWDNKYKEVVALCRLSLTKALLSERNSKGARILLDILSKRDKVHWSDSKDIAIKSDTTQPISISIVGV